MDVYKYEIVLDGSKLDEYKRGLISGIMYVLTGMPKKTYSWGLSKDGCLWYKTLECTSEQFTNVITAIEDVIPGVILDA